MGARGTLQRPLPAPLWGSLDFTVFGNGEPGCLAVADESLDHRGFISVRLEREIFM